MRLLWEVAVNIPVLLSRSMLLEPNRIAADSDGGQNVSSECFHLDFSLPPAVGIAQTAWEPPGLKLRHSTLESIMRSQRVLIALIFDHVMTPAAVDNVGSADQHPGGDFLESLRENCRRRWMPCNSR